MMNGIRMRSFLIFLLLCALPLAAEEGMWPYNAVPLDRIEAQYGFRPSPEWLARLQRASLRFNNGGSGSFVSADGLAFTNQHIGSECLRDVSTAEKNLVASGFYAATRAQELKCPNLELNLLLDITDVSARVLAEAKTGLSTADIAKAQRATMSAIEKECVEKTGDRCDVVTLYGGGQYNLYRYKKYTDIRLVFVPEADIGFFGGDPDNFEFPRYDLDICFVRVYENDKQVTPPSLLAWSRGGLKEGDLIFASGHPGGTERLDTVAQLEFLRNVEFPWRLKDYQRRLGALRAYSAQSAENARVAKELILGLENAYKAIKGDEDGLLDPELMRSRIVQERAMLLRSRSHSQGPESFTSAIRDITRAMEVQAEIFLRYRLLELRGGMRGDLCSIARGLVRSAEERKKPNSDRLREYRDSALPSLEQDLFSSAPIYKSFETLLLADSLEAMRQQLGADNPVVKQLLGNRSADEVARDAITNSHLEDVQVRKQLYDGGPTAIATSTDPLIVMLRTADSEARAVRKRFDDEVIAVIRRNAGTVAKTTMQMGGKQMAPDATFTLRLSYGKVKGYTEDGRGIEPAGTVIPAFTTLGGAYEHAAKHDNKPPYQLPESWMKKRKKLALNTPFNFVSTADIVGGNSGSPVVDAAGNLVGIIFDGNIQSLPWDYQYEDRIGRSVSVDSRGILEALSKIYNAKALVAELTKAPPQKAPAAKKPATDKKPK